MDSANGVAAQAIASDKADATVTQSAGFTMNGRPSFPDIVKQLAKLPSLEFDLVRQAEADKYGVRVTTLTTEVEKARGGNGHHNDASQGRKLTLERAPAYIKRVDGAELLKEMAQFFTRHVFLPPGAADASAVWGVHTFCFERFRHTPRLGLTSSDPRCGKTTMLDAIEMVSCKPLGVANISNAALFRTIEMVQPTLLIDEVDTFLKNNDDLRGAMNAGHKRGGQVIRCVGDDSDPRLFSVFAPAAIAAIGYLPGTLADRAISIRMQRCTMAERPAALDAKALEEGARLASMAARWCQDNADRLSEDQSLPPELFNRTADNWRALFAIAEEVGEGWFERLKAASALLMPEGDAESRGIRLLIDTKALLANCEQISSKELAEELTALETLPWAEINKGKPLTRNRLASLLKPYRIYPKDVWLGSPPKSVKGYKKGDFAEVWDRYLSDDPPNQPRESEAPRETSVSEESEPREAESSLADGNQPRPASEASSRGLAGEITPQKGDGWSPAARELAAKLGMKVAPHKSSSRGPTAGPSPEAVNARACQLMDQAERQDVRIDREKARDYYRSRARAELEDEAFDEIEAMRQEFSGP